MSDSTQTDGPPEGTRAALIAAALHLFGRDGYAAASTRAIAERAGTNVASIAYHFGGKDGLRLACAAEIARQLQAVAGPASLPPMLSPAEARTRLERTVAAVATFLLTAREAEQYVAFMLREVGEDGAALDVLYRRMFEPKHRELCTLWAAASGQDADSEAVRLSVFTLIGQVMYFRVARQIVLRRMDWPEIGAPQADRIVGRIVRNLRAMLQDDTS